MSIDRGMAEAERLDRFMARANTAYYATHDPFADFTTAPEIGQVFGELLGAWAAAMWDVMGRPGKVILAELGPGRGTLMADALRLVRTAAPGFGAALALRFVETSPRLRDVLAARFPDAAIDDAASALPPGPLIVLANEFLDALPIRQHIRSDIGWIERHVGPSGSKEERAGEAPADPPAELRAGEIVERSPASEAVVATLAARGAVALYVDYGGERETGDTLQALRDGRPADPCSDPGEADLTAHVGFERLRAVAREAGGVVHGPLAQGIFLSRLGLYPRTRSLAAARPDRAAALVEAANRLAQPERMGVLFKAMAVVPPGLPIPPGFEALSA